jgi:uncharacterized damage-inducible protein DinB
MKNMAELLLTQFGTIERQLPNMMENLTAAQLTWRPVPEANSIGFLLWHTLRTWDSYRAVIHKENEMYQRDGWPDRFGFDTTGRGFEGVEIGTGFTPEDVSIVKAQPQTLLDYLQALSELTRRDLSLETDESLSREVIVNWWPDPSSAARVYLHIIAHSFFHLGEAAYLHGLVTK